MARHRRGRPVNGVLILNKPAGLTSNAALQKVKHLLQAAKAGHAGSLDPLATGVLPLFFGEATKFSQFLLNADKGYRTTVKLGITTASGDADSEVLATRSAAGISEQQLRTALQRFEGEISQIPSMYSALKHQGQPLYKLARAGKVIVREARTVTVYTLDLLDYRPADQSRDYGEVDLEITCSKGTYIRSIAEDLGVTLGCGAHVSALHRFQAGPYGESDSVDMARLQRLHDSGFIEDLDSLLLPVATAVGHLPVVRLTEAMSFYVRQGQPVMVPHAPTSGMTQLLLDTGKFLGVGEILDDGRIAPRRLITT